MRGSSESGMVGDVCLIKKPAEHRRKGTTNNWLLRPPLLDSFFLDDQIVKALLPSHSMYLGMGSNVGSSESTYQRTSAIEEDTERVREIGGAKRIRVTTVVLLEVLLNFTRMKLSSHRR
jgi:hypothetical protein